MKPTRIERGEPGTLSLRWDDGHAGVSTLVRLRDGCPCAECSGETVLLRTYVPPAPDTTAPGRYDLVRLDPVGAYALQFTWGDGHGSGIYTWEYLRSLCECAICRSGGAEHSPHPTSDPAGSR
ncbi:MAG TPA: DUF971 domain-containing protein [Bacteroidota bacterium]|nr:DUF971 domain-containing protein [Bacteroidota bacterium]